MKKWFMKKKINRRNVIPSKGVIIQLSYIVLKFKKEVEMQN